MCVSSRFVIVLHPPPPKTNKQTKTNIRRERERERERESKQEAHQIATHYSMPLCQTGITLLRAVRLRMSPHTFRVDCLFF